MIRMFHVIMIATISFCISTFALAADRPNVVFILADDLGIGDVKCFGGDRSQIPTPNFDRLAREGMKFTDAHPNVSHCVPTRMALMTGRNPWRFAAPKENGPWGFLTPRFSTDTFTLGDLMLQAGYRTGYIGKWHLGTIMPTTDGKTQGPANVDYTKPLEIGPNDYG
ncbi:MAG TPA: sulfatase-like hydrolase/transferase, partial [Planctomycetaceae bacterium]|nr:sulfatase-like hydrolase/transferase [Planctomycetaceae bacterium]